MDAANLTEKYILWSNILDLRSCRIHITQPVRHLGMLRNTVDILIPKPKLRGCISVKRTALQAPLYNYYQI